MDLQSLEELWQEDRTRQALVPSAGGRILRGPGAVRGEGKSTLLKMMAGIEAPDSGRVIIDGKDVTDLSPNKRNIAMVFQSYAPYPNMTVCGNIEFPLKMRHFSGMERNRKVMEAATLLKIDDVIDKPVTKISGGRSKESLLRERL